MTPFSFFFSPLLLSFFTATTLVSGLRYDAKEDPWNLNKEKLAKSPLDYWGERIIEKDEGGWKPHGSPQNWRVPVYTVFLDRFVNGDPEGVKPGIDAPFFWVCLGFQLIIPLGFFKFFRKEQVEKP